MKNLYLLASEKRNHKFCYYGEGPESSPYQVDTDAEAMAYSRELSAEEVDSIVDEIFDSVDGELDDSQKEELKNVILSYCEKSDKPFVDELNGVSDEIDQFLQNNGIDDVSTQFNFSREDEIIPGETKRDISKIPVTADGINAFPEGKDDLQIKLDQKRDRYTGFVDPEKGLMYFTPSGERKYDDTINVENVIMDDLSGMKGTETTVTNGEGVSEGRSLQEMILGPDDLIAAVKAMNPNATFTAQDAEVIFGSIQGSLDFVTPESGNLKESIYRSAESGQTQVSITRLQDAFSSISPEFSKIVNGLDGKYGKGTRTGVRTLGAMLANMVTIYQTEAQKNIRLNADIQTIRTPETIKIYQEYDEIAIVSDSSTSMANDMRYLANDVKKVNTQRGDGRETSFSFSTFEKTAKVVNPLQEGQEGLDDVVTSMRRMKTSGSTEYGIDAAISMMQDSNVFSDETEVTYTDPATGAEVTRAPRRRMEIFTDENLQGVSSKEVLELERLAKEKGVDVVIVISNGRELERVALPVLKEMLKIKGSQFEQTAEEKKEQKEQLKDVKVMVKQIKYEDKFPIDELSSFDGDTTFLKKKTEYKKISEKFGEDQQRLSEINASIDTATGSSKSKLTREKRDLLRKVFGRTLSSSTRGTLSEIEAKSNYTSERESKEQEVRDYLKATEVALREQVDTESARTISPALASSNQRILKKDDISAQNDSWLARQRIFEEGAKK